jgi:hypothetical protein
MLANDQNIQVTAGSLGTTVHMAATQLHALLDFIAAELPLWRDHPDRPTVTSERDLTSQLCSHLTSACRRTQGWDFLQFRTELPDEAKKSRSIDLAPVPCDAAVWVGGRCHTQFDMLLPIECKRLPTPPGSKREEREYVITERSTTGGMQRFKAGYHGAVHRLGAMIGYVQQETASIWHGRVTTWIEDLVTNKISGWSKDDLVHFDAESKATGVTTYNSTHAREHDLPDIGLRHLWIAM